MTATTTEQAAQEPILTFPRRSFDTDPQWIAARADARALGLKPEAVYAFKRRHRLPLDQQLSATARELLALEQETAERVANGEQRERAQALQLIAQRATPEAAQAVAAVVPYPGIEFLPDGWAVCVSSWMVERYLLNRVEALTGKAYSTAGAAWQRAAKLAPAAAPAAAELRNRSAWGSDKTRLKDCRDQLALFWGVILRLDQLEGPPPADPVAFYSWCQLPAYRGHHRPAPSLGDLLAGRMRSTDARALLQLPETGPLDPAAIRSAYRAQARHHHPDLGGDRQRFEQLSAARDRLLLEVAA
jgi:hypothetical protein